MSPAQTDVWRGHISLLSGVLCHPVVSDPLLNLGRNHFAGVKPPADSCTQFTLRAYESVGGNRGVKPLVFWFWSITFHLWSFTLQQAACLGGSWERRHSEEKKIVNADQCFFFYHTGLLSCRAALDCCLYDLAYYSSHLTRSVNVPCIPNRAHVFPCYKIQMLWNDVIQGYERASLWSSGCWQLLSHPLLQLQKRSMGFLFFFFFYYNKHVKGKHSLKWHQVSHPDQTLYLGMPRTVPEIHSVWISLSHFPVSNLCSVLVELM